MCFGYHITETPIGSDVPPLGTFVSGKTITDGSLKIKFESFTAKLIMDCQAEGGTGGTGACGGASVFGSVEDDGNDGSDGRDGIVTIIFL